MQRLFERPTNANTLLLFRKVVCAYIILQVIYLLPNASLFWGDASLIAPSPYPSALWFKVFNLLNGGPLTGWYPSFIGLQLVSALMCLGGILPRLSTLLLFFTTVNLFNGSYLITNGGHQLLAIILFYLIFIDEVKESPINNMLNRCFGFAIKLQIAIFYLVAAANKLAGSEWLDGSAMSFVMQLDEYASPWMQSLTSIHPLMILLTWLNLGFQLLFPIAVWFKAIRPWFLGIGVIFHLIIALFVGLADFGILLIALYTIYLSDASSAKVLAKLKLRKRRPA